MADTNKNLSLEEILAEAKAKKSNSEIAQSSGISPDLMESLADTPPDVDSLSVYIKFGQADKSVEEITREIKDDFAKAAKSKDKTENNKNIVAENKVEKEENSQKKKNGGFFEQRMKTGYLDEYDVDIIDQSKIPQDEQPQEKNQNTEKLNNQLKQENNINSNINTGLKIDSVNKESNLKQEDFQAKESKKSKLFEKPDNWVALDEYPTVNYENTSKETEQKQQVNKIEIETETKQSIQQELLEKQSMFDVDNIPIDSTAQRRNKRLEEFFSIKENENKKEQKIAEQTAKAAESAIDIADQASVEDNIFALSSRVKKSVVHLIFSGLIMVVSLALNLLPLMGVVLPDMFNPTSNPDNFALMNLFVSIFAILISIKPIVRGVASAFSFANDTDSLLGVFSLVCLAHTIVVVFNAPVYLNTMGLPILVPILNVGLFINSLGVFINSKRMKKNYKLISSDYDKYCADIIDSESITAHLKRLSTYPQAISVSSIKTKKLTGYFTHSESDEPSGMFAKIASPTLICAALILGLFLYFNNKNLIYAFTAASIFIAITCPLTSCLSGYSLLYKLSSKLFKKGAVVTGYEAAHSLSETNGIIIDAKDLFPVGTITLHGVKTFSSERIDEAIVNVASVVYAAKGAYSDMFLEVVEGKTELLKTVDSYLYEDGMGVSAWIGSQRILVGNRQLLENHGVDAPSKDYEDRYIKEAREIIYLAVAGTLAAMFIIKYNPDNEIKYYLEKIQKAGFDIFIKTNDSNLTEEKISTIYNVDKEILKVIPGSAYPDLEKVTATRESSFAKAIHTGTFPAFASTVFGSAKLNSAMKFSVVLQIINVLFCAGVSIFMCLTGSVIGLTLPVMLAIELFWAAVIIIIPLLTDM